MMNEYAIALDLGSSGFRAQGINLSSFEITSTCITMHHPIPGSNTIDHLHFAMEYGIETARNSMIHTINRIIQMLDIPVEAISRFAVCGNPVQLSIFQGSEIRDLAYAGSRKLDILNIKEQERLARTIPACDIPNLQLPNSCKVIIPPAVKQQVGADAIALIMQTGMMSKNEVSIAIDFGTNAEMVLINDNIIHTASAAAGPAIEGQQTTFGMLAAPGAISDIELINSEHQLIVLNSEMTPCKGPKINFKENNILDAGNIAPIGITGTGIIAIINDAIDAGLIELPNILTNDHLLHLGEKIVLTEGDLNEAGKAFGAIRAGYFSLCHEAGIKPEDIQTVYMSGASGTYVDALKAQKIGLIPPCVKNIYQVGNTSLAMAKELAVNPNKLDEMAKLAIDLKSSHYMLATSEVFKKVYILELSYWNEGMPMEKFRDFLKLYGYENLSPIQQHATIHKAAERDIDDLGKQGLMILSDFGRISKLNLTGCTICMACVEGCPQKAIRISVDDIQPQISINESLCAGVKCRKCERSCPENIFYLDKFFLEIRKKT